MSDNRKRHKVKKQLVHLWGELCLYYAMKGWPVAKDGGVLFDEVKAAWDDISKVICTDLILLSK